MTNSTVRAQLLGAMNSWSFMITYEYDKVKGNDNGGSNNNATATATILFATTTATGRTRKNGVHLLRGGRRHDDKRGRRELVVRPVPMFENDNPNDTKEFMTVVDVGEY